MTNSKVRRHVGGGISAGVVVGPWGLHKRGYSTPAYGDVSYPSIPEGMAGVTIDSGNSYCLAIVLIGNAEALWTRREKMEPWVRAQLRRVVPSEAAALAAEKAAADAASAAEVESRRHVAEEERRLRALREESSRERWARGVTC